MTPPPAEQFAARIFVGPVLRAQPDRRLVDLVRDGYDAAFEEIVRRYRRPLDRFAAAFVGGRSEDVTQDAFSKALLALRGSEAEIELRPWLYRIVRNTALNDLRAAAPPAAELSEALPGGRSAAAEVEAREELRDLMDRLQALPEPQRAALVMRELEGLSHDEIAAALGVSGGAARQAIYRARAALREGFGLLVPLPLLRALADHGGEAGAAGGVVALGGALKAGMATVLIAGAVGAGVAVEHHDGRGAGPEAAEAAPLTGSRHPGNGGSTRLAAEQSSSPVGADSHGRDGRSGDDHGGGPGGPRGDGGSLGNSDRSGSSTSSDDSGGGSGGSSHSDSSSGGPGPGSGSSDDSGSGDRHGGRSGSDDGGGSQSGSGSDDSGSGGSGGDGGTSGGSGGDDGLVSSGDGGSSGSGSGGGEIESEPTTTSEPTLSDDSSGSGSGTSGGGSDGGGESSGGSSTGGSGGFADDLDDDIPF